MDKIDWYKKANKKKRDWIKIRVEYETTDISTRKIAKKYKIPYETIKGRSIREKWFKSKNEVHSKITAEIQQKTIENISDNASNIKLKHFDISDILLNKINESLKNENELNTYTDIIKVDKDEEEFTDFVSKSLNNKRLADVVNALDKLQKMQRQTLGIIDRKDELKHGIDKEKLKIEKEKVDNETNMHPVVLIDGKDDYIEWKKNKELNKNE